MKGSGTAHNSIAVARKRTFLDVLVIVSVFLVVGAFSYMVLNPGKQQSDIRNRKRGTEVANIARALAKYVETTGNIPSTIPLNRECASIGNEICKIEATDCKGYVDLSEVSRTVQFEEISVEAVRAEGNGTGYYISHDGEGSVLVCAPLAERNAKIQVKQFMF